MMFILYLMIYKVDGIGFLCYLISEGMEPNKCGHRLLMSEGTILSSKEKTLLIVFKIKATISTYMLALWILKLLLQAFSDLSSLKMIGC